MSEKPEALRLAENLVNQWYGLMASDSGLPGVSPVIVGALRLDAAAELRRLYVDNERLREALEKVADASMSMHLNAAHMATSLQGIAKAALRREEA